MTEPRGPIDWANHYTAQRDQQPVRHTADTITDNDLDALYARIETLEHVAAGNKRHVQLIVPDLEAALRRAEQAEAALARIRAWAIHLHQIGNHRTAQDGLELLALITGTPWHDLIDDQGQLIDGSYDPTAREQVTALLTHGRSLDEPKEPRP